MDVPLLKKRADSLDKSLAQSLHILQLPLGEIERYLLEMAEENKMLDVVPPPNPLLFHEIPEENWADQFSWGDRSYWNYSNNWYQEEIPGWSKGGTPPLHPFHQSKEISFTNQLVEQLRLDKIIPPECLPHCIFIAESLDSKGYFTQDLEEVAQILRIPLPQAEQALFLVQEMQPVGVAARDLQECLLLQLAKTPYFNKYTLALISQDPSLYQPLNFKWMADFLQTSIPEAQKYWQMVRGFNPIPSWGYFQDLPPRIPEAILTVEEGEIKIQFHHEGRVTAQLSSEFLENSNKQPDAILSNYLLIGQKSAENIILALQKRHSMLESIVSYILAYQQDYFLQESHPMKPLSLGDVASALEIHPTWLSRGICDKYILAPQGLVSLKSFLSTQQKTNWEEDLHRDSILSRLRMLIAGEDKRAPLSDEKLKAMLEGFSISISRRTIAKYRGLLEIPSTTQRKIKE